jgi:hypothetical protein
MKNVVWISVVGFVALICFTVCAQAQSAPQSGCKLDGTGCLLFGDLKLTGAGGITNTSTSTFVTTAGLSPLSNLIQTSDVYSFGLSFQNKAIVHQFLDLINKQTTVDKYSNRALDFLIDPWRLNAGVSWGQTLQTQRGVLTDKLMDQVIFKAELDYTLGIDTVMEHLGWFQRTGK